MPENDEAPAPLRLPFGHLFFGYPIVPVRQEQSESGDAAPAAREPPAFTGQGATLSGRSRPAVSNGSGSAAGNSHRPSENDGDSKWGSGGQTLGARKPQRKVIELDDD